jgi:hypothetical protein
LQPILNCGIIAARHGVPDIAGRSWYSPGNADFTDLPSGYWVHAPYPVALDFCDKVEPHLQDLGQDHQVACLLLDRMSQ